VTGAATAWNPGADSFVEALAVNGHVVYAGGRFTGIGGKSRLRIAAIDAQSGAVTAWNPVANGVVRALAVGGGAVYAGGQFSTMGGAARKRIAAIHCLTGATMDWFANAAGDGLPAVLALAVSGGAVYAGGNYSAIGFEPRGCFASLNSITLVDVAEAPEAPTLSLSPTIPSPARGLTRVGSVLPSAAIVSFAVYDVAGRRVAMPLDQVFEPAGAHQVELDTGTLPAGCYHYRLTAGGASLSRSMVVLR
jgi:hypothetical protein